MTGYNHGMTGAVIALSVKQPAVAVPLAFASHFVQDIVPHWNYGVSRKADAKGTFFTKKFDLILLADFLFSISMMAVLGAMFPAHKWFIWACMIAAASPDLMWAYYRLYIEHYKKRQVKYDPLARLHKAIQWSQTTVGGFIEILWFAGAWAIILAIR